MGNSEMNSLRTNLLNLVGTTSTSSHSSLRQGVGIDVSYYISCTLAGEKIFIFQEQAEFGQGVACLRTKPGQTPHRILFHLRTFIRQRLYQGWDGEIRPKCQKIGKGCSSSDFFIRIIQRGEQYRDCKSGCRICAEPQPSCCIPPNQNIPVCQSSHQITAAVGTKATKCVRYPVSSGVLLVLVLIKEPGKLRCSRISDGTQGLKSILRKQAQKCSAWRWYPQRNARMLYEFLQSIETLVHHPAGYLVIDPLQEIRNRVCANHPDRILRLDNIFRVLPERRRAAIGFYRPIDSAFSHYTPAPSPAGAQPIPAPTARQLPKPK